MKRICFEFNVRKSITAKGKLLDAIIKCGACFDAHQTLFLGSYFGIIEIPFDKIEQFKEISGIKDLIYRSPTILKGSTITAIYKSPQEEIESSKKESICKHGT